jgi:hypothetical protein
MSEQQLNSLERFRKKSDRLVLEEHSHCEVPAGCGGVVLRWHNPQAALPLRVHCYTPGKKTLFLDSVPLENGRPDVPPGGHVLGIVLEEGDLSRGFLLFAAEHDPMGNPRDKDRAFPVRPVKIATAGDGTWKFTLEQPEGDDWLRSSFDDRSWAALVETPMPPLSQQDHGQWQSRQCVERGAVGLGLPPGKYIPTPDRIWIRKVFTVPSPP